VGVIGAAVAVVQEPQRESSERNDSVAAGEIDGTQSIVSRIS
jgi:hypothetical protein